MRTVRCFFFSFGRRSQPQPCLYALYTSQSLRSVHCESLSLLSLSARNVTHQGKHKMEEHDDSSVNATRAQQLRAVRDEQREAEQSLQPSVLELSRLIGTISTELSAQHDAVQFVADAAAESRDNLRKGIRELEQATERPSFMKEFVVTFILLMTLLLLFLDWFSP